MACQHFDKFEAEDYKATALKVAILFVLTL